MKRWIIAGGLAALLTAALLTAFAFTGPEPVGTEDIDAIYDPFNQRLDEATFVPAVSREEVIDKALEGSESQLGSRDRSVLEIRTTVGLYTGADNRGNPVVNRKV